MHWRTQGGFNGFKPSQNVRGKIVKTKIPRINRRLHRASESFRNLEIRDSEQKKNSPNILPSLTDKLQISSEFLEIFLLSFLLPPQNTE